MARPDDDRRDFETFSSAPYAGRGATSPSLQLKRSPPRRRGGEETVIRERQIFRTVRSIENRSASFGPRAAKAARGDLGRQHRLHGVDERVLGLRGNDEGAVLRRPSQPTPPTGVAIAGHANGEGLHERQRKAFEAGREHEDVELPERTRARTGLEADQVEPSLQAGAGAISAIEGPSAGVLRPRSQSAASAPSSDQPPRGAHPDFVGLFRDEPATGSEDHGLRAGIPHRDAGPRGSLGFPAAAANADRSTPPRVAWDAVGMVQPPPRGVARQVLGHGCEFAAPRTSRVARRQRSSSRPSRACNWPWSFQISGRRALRMAPIRWQVDAVGDVRVDQIGRLVARAPGPAELRKRP